MPDIAPDSHVLHHIHRAANDRKFFCHFTGFLEGIASSGYIEAAEVAPLIAECRTFLSKFADGDANDILADLELDLVNFTYLADVIAYRAAMIDVTCPKSSLNRFLGVCRGVVCDGVVTTKEAQHLLSLLLENPNLSTVVGVSQIRTTCADALEDGIVTPEESAEICDAIEKIVGDSYADTGLSQANGVANFDEYRFDDLPQELDGAVIVLTGCFRTSPRRLFEDQLIDFGAQPAKTVTKRTDFLIIGGEASPHWIEMNCGGKLRQAQKYREREAKPHFVSESQLLRLMAAR